MSTKKPKPNIAIIGSGIAGLSAAYALFKKHPDAQCSLLEQHDYLGGIIQTQHIHDCLIEKGPDAFLYKPHIAQVVQDLGLEDQLIEPIKAHRKSYIIRNGKMLATPKGFYLMGPTKTKDFLMSPALSWPTKFRTLLEPWIAKETHEDESLASFVTRRFGKGNLEEITQSMIGGIYTADPHQLSMQSTMPQFVALEQKYGSVLKGMKKEGMGAHARGPRYGRFRTFKNGMQTLVDSIEAQLPASWIRKNTSVESVDQTETDQWSLRINGQMEIFDQVLFATPPRHVAQMAHFLSSSVKKDLQDIAYASSAVAHFVFDRACVDERIQAMGMIVPVKEKKHILASTFCSQKFEGRAPQGKVLVRAFLGGALQEDLLAQSDDELLTAAWLDLQMLVGIQGQPQHATIQRWPNSMPQYTLGHATRIARIRKNINQYPGLNVIGNGYQNVGIPDLIEQSTRAIDRLLD